MKDKFTFRERQRLAKGRWWVPLLKLTSVDIAASQPESFLYSPFKPTESWLARKWESDQSQCVILLSLSVCERETRERTGVVLVIWKSEVGPGQPRGRCVLNFYLRCVCPKCLFTNIPKQTSFLVFFIFWEKNIKVFKNTYVIKFEFSINRNSNNKR